jgi:asparagine synthase (glutamine-hydrolysing)
LENCSPSPAGDGEQFSNADNMSLVAVLSTGLLHEQLIRRAPGGILRPECRTVVDRVGSPEAIQEARVAGARREQ